MVVEGSGQLASSLLSPSQPLAAFDLLSLNGRDLRDLPLLERKRRLLDIMPTVISRTLFVEHLEERGTPLYRAACQFDLEGIVAKWKHGPYCTDGRATSWLKIKNPDYSQMKGRSELFEQRGERRNATAKLPLLISTGRRSPSEERALRAVCLTARR